MVKPDYGLLTAIKNILFSTENSGLTYDVTNPQWRFHNLDSNSEGVTFGLKSHSEIFLSIQGKALEKSQIFYQLVIGAEDNTVSWISMVKKGNLLERWDWKMTI